MTINGWLQIIFFFVVVLLVTKPMGVFMARVFSARTYLSGSRHAPSGEAAL